MPQWLTRLLSRANPKPMLGSDVARETYTYLKVEVKGTSQFRPGASQHELLLAALERRNFWKRTGQNRFEVSWLGRKTELILPPNAGLVDNLKTIVLNEARVVFAHHPDDHRDIYVNAALDELRQLLMADGFDIPEDFSAV
jgi:hypothetical protein